MITVASLNLHGGRDAQRRPYDVVAAIRGLEAELICLQEDSVRKGQSPHGPADQVAQAARELSLAHYRVDMVTAQPVGAADGSTANGSTANGSTADGSTADTRRSRLCISVLTPFPVTGYEVIPLGHGPGDDVPRVAQVLMLQAPDSSSLRLVNTHLTHSLASPLQLWRLWSTLRADPVPTVIVGDLNMPAIVARRFPGLTELVSGRTFPSSAPVVQLDHVLVSRGVEPGPGLVLPDAGSDHLPVRARFRLPGRRIPASGQHQLGIAGVIPGSSTISDPALDDSSAHSG